LPLQSIGSSNATAFAFLPLRYRWAAAMLTFLRTSKDAPSCHTNVRNPRCFPIGTFLPLQAAPAVSATGRKSVEPTIPTAPCEGQLVNYVGNQDARRRLVVDSLVQFFFGRDVVRSVILVAMLCAASAPAPAEQGRGSHGDGFHGRKTASGERFACHDSLLIAPDRWEAM
jgi:hypothetical protein